MNKFLYMLLVSSLIPLSACAETNNNLASSEYGYNPKLAAPEHNLIPTVNVATAIGWPNGQKPIAAAGFNVTAFTSGLDHPRWIYVLPNGDVLVAETNAPPKPEDSKGIKGMVMKHEQSKAGAAPKSANRIMLLRDTDGDGIADMKTVFIKNLNSPFGMALVGNNFYVADTDALLSFPYNAGDTSITSNGTKIIDLPAGEINHHWTKNVIASEDGKYLYVTVGSNSNAAENGIDKESNRAQIMQVDIKNKTTRIFASGLRNPVGLGWQPENHMLWVAVNERDELGDHLPPDYITSVHDGGFYGWPYSYYGNHVDNRVKPQNPDMVAKAIIPDYALGAHTASLGLTFYNGNSFPDHYNNGAFIGQHGSWNRKTRSGYKVIFVPFKDGKPAGMPEDILTGFLDKNGNAYGRPVGVAVDKDGNLLVADDVGNTIWKVSYNGRK